MSSPAHRRPLATALALVLAIESVTAVAVAAGQAIASRAPDRPNAEAASAAEPASSTGAAAIAGDVGLPTPVRGAGVPDPGSAAAAPSPEPAGGGASGTAAARPSGRSLPGVTATALAATSRPAAPAAPAAYRGRNHLWIPGLGIDRSVAAFPCSRSRPPDNLVYRWGCAGRNNVYLFGHAHSVFRGLNRAYENRTLRAGLRAVFADANGRVRTYSVAWWKVVRPTPDAAWAWASLTRPSMTLQTCVGRNSEYRLMVRLVEIVS